MKNLEEKMTICFKNKIPVRLHRQAKIRAVENGITVPQIYILALNNYLN